MAKLTWRAWGMASVSAIIGAACEINADPTGAPSGTPTAADAGTPTTAAPPSIAETSCNDAQLQKCVAGGCMVTAPPGSLAAGEKVTLAEHAVPPELAGDAIGTRMCKVTLPPSAQRKVMLTVSANGSAPPDSALFRWAPPAQGALLIASTANVDGVSGLVGKSGSYGMTKRPVVWRVESILGAEKHTSVDTPTLLRNIGARGVHSSFYDGQRLFVGNRDRVLIYDGIPTSPAIRPTVVVGEPDLDTATAGVSAASLGSGVRAIWSNGTKLIVGTGHRVLIWNKIPTTNYAPADIVLGQPDFSSQLANVGGVSATTFSDVRAIDSDGTRLIVADMHNHRVLVWNTFPTTNAEPASAVIGQGDLTSNVVGAGAVPMYQAWGVALFSGGAFVSNMFQRPNGVSYVADLTSSNPMASFSLLERRDAIQPNLLSGPSSVFRTPGGGLGIVDGHHRIAMFSQVPTTPVSTMDFVLGMPDATRDFIESVSASALTSGFSAGDTSASSTSSVMMIANGHRLLAWDTAPTYNFEPASRVIGQAGFTTNQPDADYRRISAKTLAEPADVAISGNHVAVADRSNNRVLLFETSSLSTVDPAASVVLGQPDASSFIPNVDQRTPSAARMNGPAAVAFAGSRLVVADTENHRVLVWNTIPTTTGAGADLVLGQADFVGRRPNRGRGDVNPKDGFSDAAADGFFYPMGVTSDGTKLFIADRLNNRVLVWTSFPTTNGQPADAVIGQPDMTSLGANRGQGRYKPAADGFSLPSRISLVGSTLWVADTENNRVVRVENAATAPSATAFLGQPDGTTNANLPVYPEGSYNVGYRMPVATTNGSVLRPHGVAVANGRVYVSEHTSNRVHVFDETSSASLGVLGQSLVTSATANAGGLSAASLATPLGLVADGTRLLIADSANNRVVGHALATPPATGASATILLGQTAFVLNGFDQSVPVSAGGSSRPRGVVRDNDELYVAESDHNRVVMTSGPPSPTSPIVRILGQPDDNQRRANAGGAPSARTLANPRDVAVDAQRVVVADTANSRVLVFARGSTSPDATLVLGQNDFTSVGANRNGAPAAATLNRPQGVAIDGQRLIVADTDNSRVLVWNTFPTTNGQAADLVLGQGDMTSRVPNRGDAPTAMSLSLPIGVKVVGGSLFVADSGNNRVLRFDAGTLATSAAASAALGQADVTTRGTTADPIDTSRLAGPTGLSSDGAHLYVADRDLSRVVVYSLANIVTGAQPRYAFSARSGIVLSAPNGVGSERAPFFTSRLYVADTNAHRILTIASVSRLTAED